MLIFLVVAIANLFFESAKAISWSSGWYSKGTSWLQWDDSCKTWADSSSWLTWESYMLFLVETIPPGGGIVFTSSEFMKSIPSPLTKNKVNHINKIIMTKLSLMHPCLFSIKKNQFVLRILFSWSIAINLQRLA